jgi:hypothetical protein
VALPETLQMRIAPQFADRVRAGAPEPARALTLDEVSENLRFFADPGPRGRPISGLVLSGLPATLEGIAEAVAWARARSVRRCAVHVDRPRLVELTGSPLIDQVDTLVVAVRVPVVPEVPVGSRIELHAVVPLEPATADQLSAVLAAVRAARPARVVLTWPFPGSGGPGAEAMAASMLVPKIRAALPALEGLPWVLKGLPACALTDLLPRHALEAHVWRSANRWYVDAAHQRERALLFLPEVVRFAKREVCRFCALDPRCDGVAEAWLAQGLVGPLVPFARLDEPPAGPDERAAAD